MVRSLRHCLLSVSSMFYFHFIGCESVSIEGGELNREIVKFPLFLLIHVSNFDAVMKCFLKLRMHPQETTGFELNRLIRFQQKWILKYPRKPGLHSPFALVAQLILQPIPWKNLLYGPLWNCRMELMICVWSSPSTLLTYVTWVWDMRVSGLGVWSFTFQSLGHRNSWNIILNGTRIPSLIRTKFISI